MPKLPETKPATILGLLSLWTSNAARRHLNFLIIAAPKSGSAARFAPDSFDAPFLVGGNFAPQWLPAAEYQVRDRYDEHLLTDVSIQIEHAHDAALVAAIVDLRDPAPLLRVELRRSTLQ